MNYDGKRIVIIDFETYFDRKAKYDIKSMSITTYIRDSRFWPLGLAYRFLDDEQTHWLAGAHAIEAWVASVDWKNTVVVAHNCKFDGAILAWRYNVRPYAWMDTVGLSKAVLGNNISGYSLKRLAEYMGLPPKGEMSCERLTRLTTQQSEELGVYCKNDVDICWRIYEKLITQFPQSQLAAMDWTIRAFLEPKLTLDEAVLRNGVENEKARREEIIKKSGVDRATLSSNKQFAEHLANQGYTVPTKISGRTGKAIPAFARTDNGLAALAIDAPELHAARIASKSNLLETRGESLLAVAKTGSFPFDVGFSGAVQTHRYSGGSGAGGNPQNFTRNSFLRDAICSPEGYQLVVGDFAAIELRLLAWLAKEPKLMGKIINDEDIYADFASIKYGRKITKADKVERQFGKCLAEGTQVLTAAGWKNIESVTDKDRLWDGEEWVTHQGLQYNGLKETLGLNGLYLTPDHKVLCGTDWKESQYLARDESILFRALATGSERLPLRDMFAEVEGALLPFFGGVNAEGQKLPLMWRTSELERRQDVTTVLKNQHKQRENYIGVMQPTWPTMNTARDFLIAYRQLLLGAIVQRINNSCTMVLVESQYARNGNVIGELFLPISSLSLDGMYQRLRWIGRTLMATMNQEMLDLYLAQQISAIKEGLKTSKQRLRVYDLLSAGPRNRFTVLTALGPVIVHNCSILGLGYNMGAKKFRLTVKTQTGLDISEDDAWKTVDLYRKTYFNVPKLWEQAHALLPLISSGKIGCIWFAPFIKVRKGGLVLPSGLEIKYPNLRQIDDEWVYDTYKKAYEAEQTKLYGGKMIENICQALAGELCKEAIERAEANDIQCVGQVHDEIIAVEEDGGFIYTPKEAAIALKRCMEQAPKWMPTLRLKAEVSHGKTWNEAKL